MSSKKAARSSPPTPATSSRASSKQNFPTYISDTFTAEMEDELDEIADGKREYAKTLKRFLYAVPKRSED